MSEPQQPALQDRPLEEDAAIKEQLEKRKAAVKATAFPKWLRELDRFLPLKSGIFLHGNIYDSFYFPSNYKKAREEGEEVKYTVVSDIRLLLERYLRLEGYQIVLSYDPLDGFQLSTNIEGLTLDNLVARLKEDDKGALPDMPENQSLRDLRAGRDSISDALSVIRAVAACTTIESGCIVTHVSRIAADPTQLGDEERRHFLKLLKAAQGAFRKPPPGRPNTVLMLCDKLNDIPPWLQVDNPVTRGIELPVPDRDERRRFFQLNLTKFHEGTVPMGDRDRETLEDRFADLTEGMTNYDIDNLAAISRRTPISVRKIDQIVDLYRYGERESFWENLKASKVEGAAERLAERVKGQSAAVERAAEILRRARLGLNAIEGGKSSRPKGVLFLAGPTGTGKTELAKAIAELVFNDEQAIVRFDMSEYGDSNSDVKLIGSPPGYVGYDAGGQLTRRVRARPFSVILFDEIDKAHPKIFDKFLQILDDGRLTDGKGETVYFGESVILFTSNLGVFTDHKDGGRTLNPLIDPTKGVAHNGPIIQAEIKSFFVNRLGRPEILNRFGDNFVVFDFISPPAAIEIINKMVAEMSRNLGERKKWQVTFEEEFAGRFLMSFLPDLADYGGRGIRNRVDTHVKNGLSNFLYRRPEDLAALDHGGELQVRVLDAGTTGAQVGFSMR